MATMGKRKGSAFEREISKRLSIWWSHGKSDNLFWRTQSSGGRATQRLKKGLSTGNQGGDVTSSDPSTHEFSSILYIECKTYKDIGFWAPFTGSKGGFLEWWKKTRDNAYHEGKWPVLIVKENNKPTLWMCDEDLCEKMIKFFDVSPICVYLAEDCGDICVYNLDCVLQLDIECFKALLKEASEID